MNPDALASDQTSPPATGILKWLVAATFIVILNETVMVTALPRLMAVFAVDATVAQWLSTIFMLGMAVGTPMTGWFLQRVTTRTAFLTAMGIFCVGTALAAAAPAFWVLMVARLIQSLGTAVMLPLLMSTVMTVVPEADRGRMMGNVTLVIAVAPACGPALSGAILRFADWRWIFGAVLPLALVITALAFRGLTNVGQRTAAKLDVVSVGLAAFGFATLVFGLSQTTGESATFLPAPAVIAAGALGVGLFVWRQVWLQRHAEPFLDLRTLSVKPYRFAVAVCCIAFMGMLGVMVLLPIFLQTVRGFSPVTSGLALMPGGLLMGLLGPVIGRLFDRFGARVLVIPGAIGFFGCNLALWLMTSATTPLWAIMAYHVVLSACLGAMFTPAFTVGLGSLPGHLYTHGSSFLGATQQVCGALGTALMVAIMVGVAGSTTATHVPSLVEQATGMKAAFLAVVVLSGLVVAGAFFVPARVPAANPPR